MDKILNLIFGEGGLLRVRAIIALGLTAVTSFMWVNEIPVSDQQELINGIVLAFYFGTRGAEGVKNVLADVLTGSRGTGVRIPDPRGDDGHTTSPGRQIEPPREGLGSPTA